jgi:translocation and assembly module TamB
MKLRPIFIWFTGLLTAVVLLVGALLLTFWVWTDSDTSLATALQQASRYLPAGQVLVAEDVRGTLRKGGHIGLLRWEKNGLVVEARQVDLTWQALALLDRRLQLDTLHVAQLSVDDQSPASPAAPLDNLLLPFQVDLTFVIDALHWAGAPQATHLSGHYQFEGTRHVLTLKSAQLAAGQYQAQASVLAQAPLTLEVQVQGDVQAPLPGNVPPLPLAATASVRGHLAGPDARLEVLAEVRPASPSTTSRIADKATTPMQARLAAKISPWAAQPIVKADATFNDLNLAALWPQAPQTLLTGSAAVQPDTTTAAPSSWLLQGKLTNRLSGPWDLGRLPVDAAQPTWLVGGWPCKAS